MPTWIQTPTPTGASSHEDHPGAPSTMPRAGEMATKAPCLPAPTIGQNMSKLQGHEIGHQLQGRAPSCFGRWPLLLILLPSLSPPTLVANSLEPMDPPKPCAQQSPQSSQSEFRSPHTQSLGRPQGCWVRIPWHRPLCSGVPLDCTSHPVSEQKKHTKKTKKAEGQCTCLKGQEAFVQKSVQSDESHE